MNNLKRILSLALASVMLVGMMVVGASAAEFTDGEDIGNKAAVDTMTALGVIGGYDDGSFRPEGNVTRGQMAKMIAVALNGGKDPKTGMPTTPTFTDTANHWAAEYIEYCANLGIIDGRGNGIFDPEGNVTGQEAAKMMLVALGYDAEIFGLKGSKWAANVDYYASNLTMGEALKDEKGEATDSYNSLSLYDGVSGFTANPINRENAAQLIYNGLNAHTVTFRVTGVQNGAPVYSYNMHNKSLLESSFKATVKEGVLTGATYTAKTKTWEYRVDNTALSTEATAIDASDLFMQKVRVVTKGDAILAITPANVNDVLSQDVVANLEKGGYDKDEKKYYTLDGKKVLDGKTSIDTLPVYTFLNTASTEFQSATMELYDQYRLIDNNGDGVVDCMVVIDVTVTSITRVTADSITLATGAKITLKDNKVEEDLAKGNYVTVVQNPQTKAYTVAAAKTMTGTVEAIRDTADNANQIRVDGVWYTAVSDKAYDDTLSKLLGSEAELVMVGNLVYTGSAVTEKETASDAVMAVKAATKSTEVVGDIDTEAEYYLQVRVLMADKSVEVLKVTGKVTKKAEKPGEKDTIEAVDENTDNTFVDAGALYTFSTDKNGYTTLTPYTSEQDTLTDPTINEGVAEVDKKSFRFNDDAVIFVYVDEKTYTVLSGADVNGWAKTKDGYTTEGVLYGTKSSNGFTYTTLGALTMASIPGVGVAEETYYGIITADASRVLSEKKYYVEADLWNGEENVTIKANKDAAVNAEAAFTKGTVVTYTVASNGEITLKVVEASDTVEIGAIEAYDGLSTVKFVGNETEFDISKAILSFVDTEKVAGEANAALSLAESVSDEEKDGVYANVWIIWTDNTKKAVSAIVTETNGRIYDEKGDAIVIGAAAKPETHTHSWTRVEAKAATCTEAGNKEYYHCTAAGCPDAAKKYSDEGTTELVGSEVIDATGHTMEYTYDTDSDPRTHSGKCSVCNGETVSNETCDSNGPAGVCSKCNTEAV